jgi:hypothetical protein
LFIEHPPIEAHKPVWDTGNLIEDPHMHYNAISSRLGDTTPNVVDAIANWLIKEIRCLESHFKTTDLETSDDSFLVLNDLGLLEECFAKEWRWETDQDNIDDKYSFDDDPTPMQAPRMRRQMTLLH